MDHIVLYFLVVMYLFISYAMLSLYHQSYVVCNLFLLIFFLYRGYQINRKKFIKEGVGIQWHLTAFENFVDKII